MKKVIIIGNGFDLANGIKSSYNDFLLDALKTSITNAARSKYVFPPKLVGEYKIEENLLYKIQIARLANESEIIEQFQKVKTLQALFDLTNPRTVTITIKSKIINQFFDNWSDFEKAYFECLKKIHEDNKLDQNKSLKSLNEEFKEIRKRLIDYLKRNQLNNNISYSSNPGFQELLSILHPSNNKEVLLVSFNYTNTLDHYIPRIPTNQLIQTIHIHGNINDFEEEDEIIFGYDDDQNETYKSIFSNQNQEYIEFFKQSLYKIDNKYTQLQGLLNTDYFEALILGHSLENSDSSILRKILNHPKCSAIRIYYNPLIGLEDFNIKSRKLMQIMNNTEQSNKIVSRKQSEPMPQPL